MTAPPTTHAAASVFGILQDALLPMQLEMARKQIAAIEGHITDGANMLLRSAMVVSMPCQRGLTGIVPVTLVT